MIIKIICPFCKKQHCVEIDDEKYKLLTSSHKPIQEIFPELSATEREKLITGLCEDCQKMIFGK